MEERPDYVVYRAKRIWYLAYKLALVNWTRYTLLHILLIIRRPIDIWSMTTLRLDGDEMSPLYENRRLTVSLLQVRLRQSPGEC
jgi:hypothetical protein